jgi:hypothetical protein
MTAAQPASTRTTTVLRYAARIIALLWAGWWMFSGLASGSDEGLDILGILKQITTPGLLFLVFAVIAWRWEGIGALYLVATSLLIFVGYLFTHNWIEIQAALSMLIALAAPPLVAGGLFIACWWKSRATGTHKPA